MQQRRLAFELRYNQHVLNGSCLLRHRNQSHVEKLLGTERDKRRTEIKPHSACVIVLQLLGNEKGHIYSMRTNIKKSL